MTTNKLRSLIAGAVLLSLASCVWFSEPAESVSRVQVNTDQAQTLSNKTLLEPIIATIRNTGLLTLPTSTDTLVGRATTDTLTNKSVSGLGLAGTLVGNFTLVNTRPCATGYSRESNGFCHATVPITVGYTPTVACTGRLLDADLPSNKLVMVRATWHTKSNNAPGLHAGVTNIYGSADTCPTVLDQTSASMYEQAVVSAGAIIDSRFDIFLTHTIGGTMYSIDSNIGGNGTSYIAALTVLGYFDN